MADLPTEEALANYKGLLIQYCQERGLQQPIYTETQHGSANAPRWQVTVAYGEHIYETPEPILGSKKFAHQIASQQVLTNIDARRESFLAGDTTDTVASTPTAEENTAVPKAMPMEAPLPLVSNALTIANQRLSASHPSRYRTLTDAEFSEKLSKLTLAIVRRLLERAEKDEITFR